MNRSSLPRRLPVLIAVLLASSPIAGIDFDAMLGGAEYEIIYEALVPREHEDGRYFTGGMGVRSVPGSVLRAPVSSRIVMAASDNVIPPEILTSGPIFTSDRVTTLVVLQIDEQRALAFYNIDIRHIETGHTIRDGEPLGEILYSDPPGYPFFQIGAFELENHRGDMEQDALSWLFLPDGNTSGELSPAVLFSPRVLLD